ncbi:nitroreductase/quinone reductase family protein [Actinacidiphila alni]|uniref:nitroreductase/quinone reductase family protein n=1 Tax=Actinacidiphila alni TaxID=380248 RepID=UPI00345567F7
MSSYKDTKYRAISAFQRTLENPLFRRVPFQTLVETTGRISGLRRSTPVAGRREGRVFWFVAAHGPRAQYVRNIEADPRVRVRFHGRWYTGTAQLRPEDDTTRRLRTMPRLNTALLLLLGTDAMTIRVDLTSREDRKWSLAAVGGGSK